MTTTPGPHSTFRSSTDGWGTISANPATPIAGDVTFIEPASPATTGGARSTPTGAGQWFFSAPADFTGDQHLLVGGSLDVTMHYGPDGTGTPPAILPTPLQVRLVAGASWLERDVSGDATAGGDPATWQFNIPIEVGGWREGISGTPATLATLRATTRQLTGLWIEGARMERASWTELRHVATTFDLAGEYVLDVSGYYEGRSIWAMFTPVSTAGGYHVEVRDGPNVVARRDVDADAVQLPLEITGFTPLVGTTYTLVGWITGKASPPIQILPISLAVPLLSETPIERGVRVSWDPIEDAAFYDVRVTPLPSGWQSAPRRITTAYLDATTDDGFQLDTSYTVTVRARTASTHGPWSQELDVEINSPRRILTALRDRLITNRSATTVDGGQAASIYTFNRNVFPDGLPERASVANNALRNALGADLAITATTDPALNNEGTALDLSGTASLLSLETLTVSISATVDTDNHLQLSATVTLPEGWQVGDSFPSLTTTTADGLTTSAASLVASSVEGAKLSLTTSVSTMIGSESAASEQALILEGPVTVSSGEQLGATMTLASTTTIDSIDIALPGRDSKTMTNATVQLTVGPDGGDGDHTDLTATGRIQVAGALVQATLQLPTLYRGALSMSYEAGALPAPVTVSAALQAVGLQALSSFLSTGTSIPRPSYASYAVDFDAAGRYETTDTLVLESDATPWPILATPQLSAHSWRLTLVSTRLDAVVTQRAVLSGRVTIGPLDYAVTLDVTDRRRATLMIMDTQRVPALTALASLVGFASQNVVSALPGPLVALGEISVSHAAFIIDFSTPTLTEVLLRFEQTQPWLIAGGAIVLSGWVLDVNVINRSSDWTASGLLTGQLAFGTGQNAVRFDATLRFPVATGQPWVISLAEGSTVHVPTIAELLNLVGVDPSALPVGLSSLGGLDIDRLQIAFDLSGGRLLALSFHAAQTSTWTIINGLDIDDLDMSLVFDPNASPVFIGSVSGVVTIAGQSVNVAMLNNSGDHTAILEAAYGAPVPVTGFDALNPWLAPTESAVALPSNLPIANGFSIANVVIRFGGAGGTMDRITFRLLAPDFWTIVPDKFSITNLLAQLTLPYPVVASQIVGYLEGLLTLAGVDILVTASKPTTDTPWTFVGSLRSDVTIDFVAAINTVAAAANYTLPQDITSHGFPRSLTIHTANVRAIPDTGLFHFDGSADFDWNIDFGLATFAIVSVGGTIDIPQTAGPLTAVIKGAFTFAGIQATLALQVGTQDVETVLTGGVQPEQAANIQIAEITDGIAAESNEDKWAQVVPSDLVPLTFASASVYLNLTRARFLLYGELRYGGDGLQAAATVFCVRRSSPTSDSAPPAATTGTTARGEWDYAVALSLGDNFRFGTLFSALAIIDNYLRVRRAQAIFCDIRDQTIGQLSQTLTTILAAVAPQATSPLAGLSEDARALQRGAIFVAELDFSINTLFSNLLQIGNEATPPTVRIYALIDRSDSTQSLFTADLPDITIANTIRLTHTDAYPGIHLEYLASQTTEFALIGRIVLQGLFGRDYSFDGRLTVNETQLNARLDLVSSAANTTVQRPFGVPGIVLNELYLEYQYTFATPASDTAPARPAASRLLVGGSVAFGNGLAFTGKLYLQDGSPVLLSVLLDRELDIGLFFAQSINGEGATWPENFINIAFLPGSRIYYYKQSADLQGFLLTDAQGYTYQDGFNVDATIRLTLLEEFLVRLTITATPDPRMPDTYSGITARAGLTHSIDLGFLEIAGRLRQNNDLYTGSPVIVIKTGEQAEFGFEAGFNFLQTAFGDAALTSTKLANGEMQLRGRLTAAITLEPLGRPSFSFTYSRTEGFRVDDWPAFDLVSDAIDFVELIKDIAKSTDGTLCGTLAGLADALAFDTRFTITPAVGSQGRDIVFKLTGHYTLLLAGVNAPFLTMDFPAEITLTPPPTSFSELPQRIAEALSSVARQFVEALINNAEKFALFLAIVAGEKAVQVALELLCDGLLDSAEVAAVEAGANAVASAGGVVGVGAVVIASIVATAGGAIAASLVGHSGSNGHTGSNGDQDRRPAVPDFRSLDYESGNAKASWAATTYATGYEYEILRPDGQRLANPVATNLQQLSAAIAVSDPALPSGTYTGRVRAVRGEFKTNSAERSIDKLSTVASVSLAYRENDNQLEVSWPPLNVPQGFDVALLATGGQPSSQHVVQSPARFDAPALAPGTYTATVLAAGSASTIPSNPTTSTIAIVKPTAPTDVVLSVSDAKITVAWRPSSGVPLGYSVVILLDGQPLVTLDAPGDTVSYDSTGHGAGVYSATVQAKGDDTHLPSNVAHSVSSVTKLAGPQRVEQRFDKGVGRISAQWQAVDGASRYRVSVFNATTNTRVTQHLDVTQPSVADAVPIAYTFDIADFNPRDAGNYEMRVLAAGDGQTLDSDEVAAVPSITQLPAPASTQTLDQAAGTLTVEWQAVSGAMAYHVTVFTDNSVEVAWPVDIEPAAAGQPIPLTHIFDINSFTKRASGLHQARVRTVGDASHMDSAYAAAIPPVQIDFTLETGWHQASNDAGYYSLFSHVVLTYQQKIWAMAGATPHVVYVSEDGVTFSQVIENPPWHARNNAAGVVFDDKMWILGGISSGGGRGGFNDVWWSRDGVEWTNVTLAAPWMPRFGHCAIVHDAKMWVFGGCGDTQNMFNDVWSSTDGVNWTRVTPRAQWTPRAGAAAAVSQGRIWLVGGWGSDRKNIQEVWSSTDGVNWLQAPNPPWKLSEANLEATGGSLFLMGNPDVWDASRPLISQDQLWISRDGNSWRQLSDQEPWGPRVFQRTTLLNGRIYLLGGIFAPSRIIPRDLWYYVT